MARGGRREEGAGCTGAGPPPLMRSNASQRQDSRHEEWTQGHISVAERM